MDYEGMILAYQDLEECWEDDPDGTEANFPGISDIMLLSLPS